MGGYIGGEGGHPKFASAHTHHILVKITVKSTEHYRILQKYFPYSILQLYNSLNLYVNPLLCLYVNFQRQ